MLRLDGEPDKRALKTSVYEKLGTRIKDVSILDVAGRDDKGRLLVKCYCHKCNTEFIIKYNYVYNGKRSSCGCGLYVLGNKNRKWKGFGEISSKVWSSIIRGSKVRNIPLEITIEQGWELFLKQERRCALSGIELFFPERSGAARCASLDRIDPTKGYIEGNVQWVHPDLNYMKHTWTEEEFFDWIKTVYEYKKLNKIIQFPKQDQEETKERYKRFRSH